MRDIVEEEKTENVRPGSRRAFHRVVREYRECEGRREKGGNDGYDLEMVERRHWLCSITGGQALLFRGLFRGSLQSAHNWSLISTDHGLCLSGRVNVRVDNDIEAVEIIAQPVSDIIADIQTLRTLSGPFPSSESAIILSFFDPCPSPMGAPLD